MDLMAIQYQTELKHNQSRINRLVDDNLLDDPEIEMKFNQAVSLVIKKMFQPNIPMSVLLNMEADMMKILRIVCTEPKGTTFSALIGRMRTSDNPEDTARIGEIALQMCKAELFDLVQTSNGYLDVKPIFVCDADVLAEVHDKEHMPPMICKPKKLTRNTSSAYLSVDVSSLICGRGNHHDGELCLDALNILNSVPLELAPMYIKDWSTEHTYILENGNKFYLPHKYDKRGRIYCQGWNISYQSHEEKKAQINFSQKEIIEGF